MQNQRPVPIVVVCAILAVFTLISLPSAFYVFQAKGMGILFGLYNIVDIALSVFCLYGLWNMKKWSVILYTVLFAISLIVSLMGGGFTFFGIIVPVILLVVMYMNYQLMD
ncbi:MAG: hypothetical protein NTZ87_00960 [Candidatus Nomurabacteria bacterium]|nr:hypothetical protein [Candidatus Nomurabacteria bacterium]